VWWALNEIAQNVVDHAGTLGGGIAVAELTQGGAEFEVAIADHGIGIRASLAQNPAHSEITSDLASLRAAMEAGVTARPVKPEGQQNPGGLGLFLTHALLRDTGGGMTMRSGTAELQTGADPGDSVGLEPMRGTLVTLRFRTNAHFSLDVILAPEPGGS
jgi:hypothetical protein